MLSRKLFLVTVQSAMVSSINKDAVLLVSLVLSMVSTVLLLGVFQSSLDLLQQQAEHERELLLDLRAKVNVRSQLHTSIIGVWACKTQPCEGRLHLVT